MLTCDLGWRAPRKAYTLNERDRAVGEKASKAAQIFALGPIVESLLFPRRWRVSSFAPHCNLF